ncbi:MAG: NIPSNAP family protein [Vitreimonas sp.]
MPKLTIFELRNYEMRPGGRDVLIDLFEAHFLESQEALGAIVVGTFRALDDPNRFVWIRAFENMETRYAALDGFYTGPTWREHRNAANATMIDSDNVLLLRPVDVGCLDLPGPLPAQAASESIVVARTYGLPHRRDVAFAERFAGEMAPALADLSAAPLATFATEPTPNSFPRLPVREGETVFVTLTRFESDGAYEEKHAALMALDRDTLRTTPEIMRLSPTPRSRLR